MEITREDSARGTKRSMQLFKAVGVEHSNPNRILDPEGKADFVTTFLALRNITEQLLLRSNTRLPSPEQNKPESGLKAEVLTDSSLVQSSE